MVNSLDQVNLHISHSWGGGLRRWVLDFCRHDSRSRNLVLESVGTPDAWGLGYRLLDPVSDTDPSEFPLRWPISETTEHSGEYRDLLEALCERHGVTHIYLSSLIGHSLNVFDLGIPVTRVHHDYHPFCPNVYIYFDEVCTSCETSRLDKCLKSNELEFANRKSSSGYWEALRNKYLDQLAGETVSNVAPNPTLAEHLRVIDPRWEEIDFEVIEHGITFAKSSRVPDPVSDRRLRVGILGEMHPVKGLAFLKRSFDAMRLVVDPVFIGSGTDAGDFESRWGVRFIERYTHGELPGIFASERIDLVLLLSVFPETFSYTLSEAMANNIPPCARNVGSFSNRIEHGVNGFLFDGQDELLETLLSLDEDRQPLKRVAANLAKCEVRTAEEMIEDYYRLRDRKPGLAEASRRIAGRADDLRAAPR